ncbi:MAG: hypothetical protein J6Z26_06960, partial [Bacteroidales bacterium]|nr:hypothetical protein [Bacteroidales bacterium]
MKKILFSSLIIIIFCSCSKDLFDDPQVLYRAGVKRCISADATLPIADKAYFDYADAFKVKWSAGDKLNVNGMYIDESGIGGGVDARFEGTTYGISSISDPTKEIYWAVYPTTLAGDYVSEIPEEFQETLLTVSLPVVQTFNSDVRPLNGYNYMAAYASIEPGTQPHFYMKNLCTV